jgi:hypothetical protein
MRFHTAVGGYIESTNEQFERTKPEARNTRERRLVAMDVARQEADASSHAFDVWSGRMVTARAALTAARINRCRSRRGPVATVRTELGSKRQPLGDPVIAAETG